MTLFYRRSWPPGRGSTVALSGAGYLMIPQIGGDPDELAATEPASRLTSRPPLTADCGTSPIPARSHHQNEGFHPHPSHDSAQGPTLPVPCNLADSDPSAPLAVTGLATR